jgi:hypothetical protein
MDYLEFWQQVEHLLEPVKHTKTFYRVYYNEHGQVLFYSMEDLPGNYLDIDKDTFARSDPQAKVINGKLVPIRLPNSVKLVPSKQGQACHPENIMVVTQNEPRQLWNLKYYDQDS